MRRRRDTIPDRPGRPARIRPARRVRILALPTAALAAILAVGGCAGAGDGLPSGPGETSTEGGSTVTPPGGTVPSDPGPPPTSGGSPDKGAPAPSGPSAAMTLTGTVTAGVEPNCLLLDGYLLIGGPRDVVRSGARVSLTGRPEPGLMTTCQQGIPFRVETARSA